MVGISKSPTLPNGRESKEEDVFGFELAVCPRTCSLAEKRLDCLMSEEARDSHSSSSCLQHIVMASSSTRSSSRDPAKKPNTCGCVKLAKNGQNLNL